MGLFFKMSDKEILNDRNEIFIRTAIPALEQNGFVRSTFKSDLFGKNNVGSFTYEFIRLKDNRTLERITTHIVKGDKWIQIYLNVFEMELHVNSIADFVNISGMQFHLTPNNKSRMRLRSDDYKSIPLFYMLFCDKHKLKNYYTKKGFESGLKKLGELIQKDMLNIDSFIKRWHELHTPIVTDWEGNPITNNVQQLI